MNKQESQNREVCKLDKKDFKFIPMYDMNNFVLVCNVFCIQNLKAENTFLVEKKEWIKENSSKPDDYFKLYHTRCDLNRIYLYANDEGKNIVFSCLPLSKRTDYIEISFDRY